MRRKGADLKDRVYGPYFMLEALKKLPRPWKHFFFGGTESCLQALSAAVRQAQPEVNIVGTFSPPFRAWTEKDEEDFAKTIAKSGADKATGACDKNLHRAFQAWTISEKMSSRLLVRSQEG